MAKQTLSNNVPFGEQRTKINDNFTELYNAKVPVGGLTGQVLTKTSGADYATNWVSPSSDGGTNLGWLNVEDFGAVHDNVTDDTEAIQAAINAAHDAGGGVVYFPNGIYVIGGELNDLGCQIYVPLDSLSNSQTNTHIVLLGETPPNFYSCPIGLPGPGTYTYTPSDKGVILRSTLDGAGDVIGSDKATLDLNACHLSIENIGIRVKSINEFNDPLPVEATGINGYNLAYLTLKNVKVETQNKQDVGSEPLSTARGIVMPKTDNFVFVHADNVLVNGFYTAIEVYECSSLTNIFIDGCFEGLSFNTSNHCAFVSKVFISRTNTKVVIKGVMNFTIDPIGIEDSVATIWQQAYPVYDLDERVGGSKGFIRFNKFGGSNIEKFVRKVNAIPASRINCYYFGETGGGDIAKPVIFNKVGYKLQISNYPNTLDYVGLWGGDTISETNYLLLTGSDGDVVFNAATNLYFRIANISKLIINNSTTKITNKTNLTVSEFADNASAITGGLVVGDVYRTGDILKIVH